MSVKRNMLALAGLCVGLATGCQQQAPSPQQQQPQLQARYQMVVVHTNCVYRLDTVSGEVCQVVENRGLHSFPTHVTNCVDFGYGVGGVPLPGFTNATFHLKGKFTANSKGEAIFAELTICPYIPMDGDALWKSFNENALMVWAWDSDGFPCMFLEVDRKSATVIGSRNELHCYATSECDERTWDSMGPVSSWTLKIGSHP